MTADQEGPSRDCAFPKCPNHARRGYHFCWVHASIKEPEPATPPAEGLGPVEGQAIPSKGSLMWETGCFVWRTDFEFLDPRVVPVTVVPTGPDSPYVVVDTRTHEVRLANRFCTCDPGFNSLCPVHHPEPEAESEEP